MKLPDIKNSIIKSRKDVVLTAALAALCAIMLLLPGYNAGWEDDAAKVKASVVSVDNASVYQTGIIRQGDQYCELRVEQGPRKGEIVRGVNKLLGKLELDKVFVPGDNALIALDLDVNKSVIQPVTMIDHYRLDATALLFGGFVLFLTLFAGITGIKALLSFVVTVLAVWKVLIPGLLAGANPVAIALAITLALTLVIIYAVGGFTKKANAAVMGSLLGTLLSAVLALFLSPVFKIHGAIMPFAENLLYAGFANIDLTGVFTACIFLASSGALMDLAMDISSAVEEVVSKKPDITRKEAILSGLRVGRSVIGTMTTTLLLAYSGGYLSLLMVFAAQGTPVVNILNLKYVSAEIMHTLIGSIGLVAVAPFTAVMSGVFMAKKRDV